VAHAATIARQRAIYAANNTGAVFFVVRAATIARQRAIHAANNTGTVFSVLWSDQRPYNRSQSERTVSCSARRRMELVLVICEVRRLVIAL
jgi:hypothetical protein